MSPTMSSPTSSLEVTHDGPITRLTLSRPAQLNALNDDIRRNLADALTELEDRPDVRVVILDGAGDHFSAGADLKTGAYEDLRGADWATRRHRTGSWQRLLDLLGRVPRSPSPGCRATSSGAPHCSPPPAISGWPPTIRSSASPNWPLASP